ncbi:hypothetical protein JCM8208_005922 [Rhodotorula glutinis]
MESAVLDALDLSEHSQSQFTQTQPQTQQQSQPTGGAGSTSSRFPSKLWGVLLSVGAATSTATTTTPAPAPAAAAPLAPPPPPTALPRPERVDLLRAQTTYTVGRSPRCDLVLQGPKISSFHARITLDEQEGIVRLEDSSTNGTFVRGRKVGKGNVTVLESGDTLVFGPPADSFELEFRYVVQLDPALRRPPPALDLDLDQDDLDDPYHLGDLSQSQSLDHAGTVRSIHAAYEVREQIGKGSFATVRKAIRRSDGRIVAVKIIQRARFASNPKTMEMIEREVDIMKGLEHRFCVKCIDYFEDDQRIWLVLEYVDGGDLLDYVMKRRGLKESETREIALMVCEAVAYLHSKGISHRDLKPENLLLTRGAKPVCKVTDFGLAKMVGEGTMLKTMCGTPTYLAPEVILNPTPLAGYGNLVDAWSIGVVLYSCLTNQTPFDESESTPLPQRMRERHVDVAVLREVGVSDVACDFLMKLLVADPKKRMSCAQALEHPWLALKSSTAPASAVPTSVSAAALLSSSLPFNDPLASPALEGDESVTRLDEGASRAGEGEGEGDGSGEVSMQGGGLEVDDSGVDSQGFGNLRINNTTASPLPAAAHAPKPAAAHRLAPPTRPPVPPFSTLDSTPASSTSPATSSNKRKELMSAFSDSSLSSALDLDSPEREPIDDDAHAMEVTELVSASDLPSPGAAGAARALEPVREPLEPAAPAEPAPAPPPRSTGTDNASSSPAQARRSTPARQPRSSGHGLHKVVATPARASAARGRARAAVAAEREEAHEEDMAVEEEEEVGGIAAGVKSRRRKAARRY